MPTTPLGNVEIDLSNGGYGGDFTLDPTGDLLLAIDTAQSVPASIERLYRLILTNARTNDSSGRIIAPPDDLFNVNYGSSVRAEIGEPFDDTFIAGVTGRVLQALAQDAGVRPVPAPTVTVSNGGNGIALIDVTLVLVGGQIVTLPTIPLQVG